VELIREITAKLSRLLKEHAITAYKDVEKNTVDILTVINTMTLSGLIA
jgi:hypothetical protein